jgi:hypothetical protein
MGSLGLGIALALLAGYLLWRTVEACLRFNAWLIPLVLGVDAALLVLFIPRFWILFIAWKIWFFVAAYRWEPMRGMFRAPHWPRAAFMRGPRRNRRREFKEPMLWTRGPSSFG